MSPRLLDGADELTDKRMVGTEAVVREPADTKSSDMELAVEELVDGTDLLERTGHWSHPPSFSDSFQKASWDHWLNYWQKIESFWL